MIKILIKRKKKGFTLMELLVSLGIVAALSMMVTPMIIGKVDEAKVKADISNANAIAVAVKSEILEGKDISGDYDNTALTTLVGKYFDGQVPTAQTKNGEFVVNVTGNNVTVKVKVGENSTNYYPADSSLLAEVDK